MPVCVKDGVLVGVCDAESETDGVLLAVRVVVCVPVPVGVTDAVGVAVIDDVLELDSETDGVRLGV